MNKPKLCRNTTEAFIPGNMSMISTLGKVIFNMSKPKMKKSENN